MQYYHCIIIKPEEYGEVQPTIEIDIHRRETLGAVTDELLHRRVEAPVADAIQKLQATGGDHGQIVVAVLIEVADDDRKHTPNPGMSVAVGG